MEPFTARRGRGAQLEFLAAFWNTQVEKGLVPPKRVKSLGSLTSFPLPFQRTAARDSVAPDLPFSTLGSHYTWQCFPEAK